MQTELFHIHSVRQAQLLNFYADHYSQAISLLADQKKVLIDYKHKANYWEAQFKKLKDRESKKESYRTREAGGLTVWSSPKGCQS